MIKNIENEARIRAISEALPYIQRFNNAVIVIKYGGNAIAKAGIGADFAKDVVLLKQVGMHPVVVHGGGPQVSRKIREEKLREEFHEGLRVTSDRAMSIIEEVMSCINRDIASSINEYGGEGLPVKGYIRAKKKTPFRLEDGSLLDYGRVGTVEGVDAYVKEVTTGGGIPVISPIGISKDGQTLNVNADTVAEEVSVAVRANKLILMTDQLGVLGENGKLLPTLSQEKAQLLIASGTIHGGMLPKIACALHCFREGVKKVHIVDGRIPHVLLLELLTDQGVGTMMAF